MNSNKFLSKALTAAAVLFVLILIGCGNNSNKQAENQKQAEQQSVEAAKVDSSIIRSKDIDVNSVDKNKDGKVYQCPMDYNVISDSAGQCPLCGMELKEFSVADAQHNLNASK